MSSEKKTNSLFCVYNSPFWSDSYWLLEDNCSGLFSMVVVHVFDLQIIVHDKT